MSLPVLISFFFLIRGITLLKAIIKLLICRTCNNITTRNTRWDQINHSIFFRIKSPQVSATVSREEKLLYDFNENIIHVPQWCKLFDVAGTVYNTIGPSETLQHNAVFMNNNTMYNPNQSYLSSMSFPATATPGPVGSNSNGTDFSGYSTVSSYGLTSLNMIGTGQINPSTSITGMNSFGGNHTSSTSYSAVNSNTNYSDYRNSTGINPALSEFSEVVNIFVVKNVNVNK